MPSPSDEVTHPTNPMDAEADVEPYEVRLLQSFTFAVQESGAYYVGGGALHETLHRLVERLDASGIPYAVIGAFAMGAHGYVRMTADLDLVMTAEGLRRFTEEGGGRGYRPAFADAVRMVREFRDVETSVRIDIVEAGTFPGDGRPKPVTFPDPSDAELRGHVWIVGLAKLIELKLASSLTAADRLRDLADVQEMIRALALPRAFGGRLDGSVRGEYERLWRSVSEARAPDEELWGVVVSNTQTRPWDAAEHLESPDDMAAYLEAALEDGDAAVIAAALGDIARAKGLAQIARDQALDASASTPTLPD